MVTRTVSMLPVGPLDAWGRRVADALVAISTGSPCLAGCADGQRQRGEVPDRSCGLLEREPGDYRPHAAATGGDSGLLGERSPIALPVGDGRLGGLRGPLDLDGGR